MPTGRLEEAEGCGSPVFSGEGMVTEADVSFHFTTEVRDGLSPFLNIREGWAIQAAEV